MSHKQSSVSFKSAIRGFLSKNLRVKHDLDNLPEYKRLMFKKVTRQCMVYRVKESIKKAVSYYQVNISFRKELESIFQLVDEQSKATLLEILAYRILGYRRIKLTTNDETYKSKLNLISNCEVHNQPFNNFGFHGLSLFNLSPLGYNLNILYYDIGIMADFVLEQYANADGKKFYVRAKEGDVVLDLGGCWGDTALYFAMLVGNTGKVFSFEFVPRNIQVFKYNLSLNSNFKEIIQLVDRPVFSESGKKVFIKDKSQGSRISFEPFGDATSVVETICVDDLVREKQLAKVDFIKMDIEGTELSALKGAKETIKKFKPNLAISIYHSMHDIAHIPLWINALDLGYTFRIGHFSICEEETILFASVHN